MPDTLPNPSYAETGDDRFERVYHETMQVEVPVPPHDAAWEVHDPLLSLDGKTVTFLFTRPSEVITNSIIKRLDARNRVKGSPAKYAATVERILRMANAGWTPYRIAKTLRDEGVPTATGATFKQDDRNSGGKKGQPAWRPVTITRVLDGERHAQAQRAKAGRA